MCIRDRLTVGHELISHCESTVDLIDVISFHDYLKTRAEIEAVYTAAEQLSQKTGKPLLNTETVSYTHLEAFWVSSRIFETVDS